MGSPLVCADTVMCIPLCACVQTTFNSHWSTDRSAVRAPRTAKYSERAMDVFEANPGLWRTGEEVRNRIDCKRGL
jgi:hypothetical protein